jgi:hypothetical protein
VELAFVNNMGPELDQIFYEQLETMQRLYRNYQQYYVVTHVKPPENATNIGVFLKGLEGEDREFNFKVPKYNDKITEALAAIVSAIHIAAGEGHSNIVIFTDELNLVELMANGIRGYHHFCVKWAIPDSLERLHIQYMPKGLINDGMRRAEEIAGSIDRNVGMDIVMPTDYDNIKMRIKDLGKRNTNEWLDDFTTNNQEYAHLRDRWRVNSAMNRSSETTVTRIRVNRSRLRDDLYRWNLVGSPDCSS